MITSFLDSSDRSARPSSKDPREIAQKITKNYKPSHNIVILLLGHFHREAGVVDSSSLETTQTAKAIGKAETKRAEALRATDFDLWGI
jgi:hypothetical protein